MFCPREVLNGSGSALLDAVWCEGCGHLSANDHPFMSENGPFEGAMMQMFVKTNNTITIILGVEPMEKGMSLNRHRLMVIFQSRSCFPSSVCQNAEPFLASRVRTFPCAGYTRPRSAQNPRGIPKSQPTVFEPSWSRRFPTGTPSSECVFCEPVPFRLQTQSMGAPSVLTFAG